MDEGLYAKVRRENPSENNCELTMNEGRVAPYRVDLRLKQDTGSMFLSNHLVCTASHPNNRGNVRWLFRSMIEHRSPWPHTDFPVGKVDHRQNPFLI